ncbi:10983_t:CDS:2, partial [Racocetra persica]
MTEDIHKSSNSSSDTDDGIVGHLRDEVWVHFIRTKRPKKKHYSATCTFCKTSLKRRKPTTLKSYLAVRCSKVSNNIRIKYLRAISDENNQEKSTDISNMHPKKKLKSNHTRPLTACFNFDKIDEARAKQANQALLHWTTLSGPILDSEIANITLKLDKILKDATNLTL